MLDKTKPKSHLWYSECRNERFIPQLTQCHAILPYKGSYTVDPVVVIFTGNPGMTCAMEHHNELREVDIQAAFGVERQNIGDYVMVLMITWMSEQDGLQPTSTFSSVLHIYQFQHK